MMSDIQIRVGSHASWQHLVQYRFTPAMLTKIKTIYVSVHGEAPTSALTEPDLQFCNLTSVTWHATLLPMEFLTQLVLQNPGLDAFGVISIHPLPDGCVQSLQARGLTLRTLELNTLDLEDSDLVAIATGCPLLTTVRLCISLHESVTDEGVCAVIAGCPLLQCLSVHDPDHCLTSASLATALHRGHNLTQLRMEDTALCDGSMLTRAPPQLYMCWAVTTLCTAFPNSQVLTAIEELSIFGISEDCIGAFCAALGRLTHLRMFGLYCEHCAVPASMVESLTHGCRRLTNLHIHVCIIGDAAPTLEQLVRNNPSLVSFDLGSSVMGASDALVLELACCCPGLRRVKLRDAQEVTDASIVVLARRCHRLTAVYMRQNALLTDAGVLALAQHCPDLQSVNIGSCVLVTEDAVLRLLQSCKKLKELTVAAESISKRAVKRRVELGLRPKINRRRFERDGDSGESSDSGDSAEAEDGGSQEGGSNFGADAGDTGAEGSEVVDGTVVYGDGSAPEADDGGDGDSNLGGASWTERDGGDYGGEGVEQEMTEEDGGEGGAGGRPGDGDDNG